ncbi:hypothetical protein HFZ78_23940 [Priestia megaterium]|uniref:DUF5659 domain-containing protein n=1 Tax=Priestia megaterium TaxID=1404 RepID=A0A6H1P7Y2_PRIMG|nr:hypothetical protein [Priestia megaterium]QIZ09371.1 hypothetical protein HFZ78_23940 [Priestia megaterium]
MKQQKTIMKKSLAEQLIDKGHNFIGCEVNRRDKKMLVYKFVKTTELMEDLTRLTTAQ